MHKGVKAAGIWSVIEDFLTEHGYTIVPIEPTRAMESAGAQHALGGTATHAALCWAAMLDTAREEHGYDQTPER